MAKQKETNIWRAIMLDLSKHGFRLMRNQRYKGPIVSRGVITSGFADCGVGGDGGHDLIGYRIITITPDMVGKRIAVFTSVETKVKEGDKGSQMQQLFCQAINNAGGNSIFARSVEEAKKKFDLE